ncbi:D-glycero-beta-D-manno-heptose-7-phosphate kinase [Treponema sp.]
MITGLASFDRQRLGDLIASFPKLRVAVLGDFFLDKYLEVDSHLAEKSLETGKTAHQVVAVQHSPGAAGTVVNNLVALGVRSLMAIGFTGDDGEGYELRKDLEALGVDLSHLHTDAIRCTPTYTKPREAKRPGLRGEHERYDIKNRTPTPLVMENSILASLDAVLGDIDVLLIMDQVEDENCGVLTRRVIGELSSRLAKHASLVALADSRRRILQYRGPILKMNQFEMVGINNPKPGTMLEDEIIQREVPILEKQIGSAVFITAGERGVWIGGPRPALVPSPLVPPPVDPTGAGDSFSAGASLSLAAGASFAEAALVGNLVASVTVRKLGTTGTANRHEILEAFELWKEQQ